MSEQNCYWPHCGKTFTVGSDEMAMYYQRPRTSHFMADFPCPNCGRGIDGQLLALGRYTPPTTGERIRGLLGFLVTAAIIGGLVYWWFFRD